MIFEDHKSWLHILLSDTAKPISWPKPAYQLGIDGNNGFVNQDFLVWSRRAALPNFRKLYRRITGDLPAGNYTLNIYYSILLHIKVFKDDLNDGVLILYVRTCIQYPDDNNPDDKVEWFWF